jgi:SAM-dependent methyltransferase
VSFAVAADSYDRFMGRYSTRLAPAFADFAGVGEGMRALDVGCGPGALTRVLVDRLGADAVAAVDPSPSFVETARERHPGVDTRQAPAESLPFADGTFDAALAQLVVHFLDDPVAGIREMARVTNAGGVVAACTWDIANASPLTPFWRGVREVEPTAEGETHRPGANDGELRTIFEEAGLVDVDDTPITFTATHATFDEWWEPFTLGVGPAGQYAARLDPETRAAVREECRALLGEGPFDLPLRVWTARGTVR